MDIHVDSWTHILEHCDYVQIHVLYCTCQVLSHLTDDFLRRRFLFHYRYSVDDLTIKAHQYNFYLIKTLPLPILIYYFQPINYDTLCTTISNTVGTWTEDLYANFSQSLFDWYGKDRIRTSIANDSPHEGSAGLHKLLTWKNNQTDEELVNILDFLLKRSLIPPCVFAIRSGLVEHKAGQVIIPEEINVHLSTYLILSGRQKLLSKYSMDLKTLWKKFKGKHYSSTILELAIRSDNIEMVNNIDSMLREMNDRQYNSGHLAAALETSEEITQLVFGLLDYIIMQKFNQATLIRYLFRKEASNVVLDRCLRYIPERPTNEEMINIFFSFWDGADYIPHSIIQWLIERNFLTKESAAQYLKPLLLRTLDFEDFTFAVENMENCKCTTHKLARFLRDTYDFDMNLLPTNNYGYGPVYPDPVFAENGGINPGFAGNGGINPGFARNGGINPGFAENGGINPGFAENVGANLNFFGNIVEGILRNQGDIVVEEEEDKPD